MRCARCALRCETSIVWEENDFHWLFTTVVYQQIENSERANQIHRFTIDHCKFILIYVRFTHERVNKLQVAELVTVNFIDPVEIMLTPSVEARAQHIESYVSGLFPLYIQEPNLLEYYNTLRRQRLYTRF